MRILIIEDDKWLADSLRAVLNKNFEVRLCHNPENVFDILEKWWPDVLLADVILGAKNCLTLLNEIQSYTDTRTLPVVILSAAARSIKIEDLARYNVKKILDKAEITPDKLRETLREVVGNLA